MIDIYKLVCVMLSKRKTPAERGRSTMNKIKFYSGGIMGIAGFGWLAHTAYRDATHRTAYAYMATASGLGLLFDFVREAWKNSAAKPKLPYTIRKSGFEKKSTEQKSDALFHKKINQFLQELDTGFGLLGSMMECIQCKKALDPEVTEEQDSHPKFEEMGLDKLYDLMFDLLGSYRKGEVYKDSLAAYDYICDESKEHVKKEIARFIEEYKQQVKLLFLPEPPVGNEEPLPAMFPIDAKASAALYCCISDIADSAKEKLDKQIEEFLNKMREIEVQAIKTDYHGQLLAAMEILDGKSLFELCLLEKIKSSDQKTPNWEEVLAEMEHFRRPLHNIEAIPLELTTNQKTSIKNFSPFFEKYDKFVKTEYGKDFESLEKIGIEEFQKNLALSQSRLFKKG